MKRSFFKTIKDKLFNKEKGIGIEMPQQTVMMVVETVKEKTPEEETLKSEVIDLPRWVIDKLVYDLAKCELGLSDQDPLLMEAAGLIIQTQLGSESLISRRFKVNSNRARHIMDQLEEYGIVGPSMGSRARQVLISNTFEFYTFIRDFIEKYACSIELAKNKIEEEEIIRREFEEKESIKLEILEKERKRQLRRQVKMELIENREVSQSQKRMSIPQDVQDLVWNRDGGKCVLCGSQENLEFDHIIPVSKGGANTYRNLQLLCQNCNRSKSDKIG